MGIVFNVTDHRSSVLGYGYAVFQKIVNVKKPMVTKCNLSLGVLPEMPL